MSKTAIDILKEIAALQPKDFDTEYEHWDDGNYDDSHDYGIKCGEFKAAEIARNFIDKLNKGE